MRKSLARTLTVVGLSAGLAVPMMSSGAAFADPKAGGEPFPVTCGSTTYQVVVAGNGHWTPAHDTGSNVVLIPHTFTGFYGEVRDAAGVVVETFSEPGAVQGSGKQKNDVSCTYSFTEVSDGSDPDFPAGYTFTGGGGVTGQLVGRG